MSMKKTWSQVIFGHKQRYFNATYFQSLAYFALFTGKHTTNVSLSSHKVTCLLVKGTEFAIWRFFITSPFQLKSLAIAFKKKKKFSTLRNQAKYHDSSSFRALCCH